MKYKPEWKGRLKVTGSGHVLWDGRELGSVGGQYEEGAKSPGGMTTNRVFFASGMRFSSMTEAIESLLPAPETQARRSDGRRPR